MSTQIQIVYWRDIPAQVKARSGEDRASRPLSDRFQQAIDQAAMMAGMAGTDEYLGAWRTSAWEDREGSPEHAAHAATVGLEREYPEVRLRRLVATGGVAD
jgi:hypothetical protein